MRNIFIENVENHFDEQRDFLIDIRVKNFLLVETFNYLSDKISVRLLRVPNVSYIWWWIKDFRVKFRKCNLMTKIW